MKLGVAIPEATTLPLYRHDDASIIAALDAWADRIGDSIRSATLYPAIFPIWCDLSGSVPLPAPVGFDPPSSWLLDGLRRRGVRSAVYLQTSGWRPPHVPNRPNARYLAGDYDDELRGWAKRAASRMALARITEPLLVRVDWEMNGSWAPWSTDTSPAEFIAMWQHIVTVMRDETDRLAFWWCPTARGDRKLAELDDWWPGHAYVDVLGFDSYDSGDGRPSIGKRWWPTFAWLDSLRFHKPIIVGETCIVRLPGNARVRTDWWRGLRDIERDPAWSALTGVVAFDVDMTPWEGEGKDWRLNAGMRRVTARMLR